MTYTPIADAFALSGLIQPFFTEGLFVQPNRSLVEFEYMSKIGGDSQAAGARNVKFSLLEGLDYRSAGMKNPGNTSFLKGYRTSVSEYTATLKEMQATVELEASLVRRAMAAKELRYDDPLAVELQNKVIALKRILGMYLHNDGSGRIGESAGAGGDTDASGRLVLSLERTGSEIGCVRHFLKNDLVSFASPEGDERVGAHAAFFAWRVIDRDTSATAPTVTLQAVNQAGVAIGSASASNIVDGDFAYRTAQGVTDGSSLSLEFPDVSGAIADYGALSCVMPGFESLIAADGRVVHGVTMSGVTGAQSETTGGTLDSEVQFEELLNTLKDEQGEGVWKYDEALTSRKVRSALIKSASVDRRYGARDDLNGGGKKFTYMHGDDEIAVRTSEFCRDDRIWVIPSGGAGGAKVLQFHYLPFEAVRANNGDEWHLIQSSGVLTDLMQSVQRGFGTTINLQPAATGRVSGFTL